MGYQSDMTTSDLLLQRLREWGVSRVFGYPGDGINGLMGAFERAKSAIEFIQVRHEETAAFMACAHAKFTGDSRAQPSQLGDASRR